MSVRRLSPTANLFRNSRLFSLPPPLPRPATDISAISNFDSDTATTSYPTYAAIETTQSSLARGDWGLKRALPLKSTTQSSTPIIRIDNIDSIDHITDFGSAADHAITLRKWQQLDMPISIPTKRIRATNGLQPAKSVFDSNYDNTAISDRKSASGAHGRWKFKGPWLAGKTDGQFNDFVEKKVKRRKLDFRQYLTEHLAQIRAAARRREAVEKGEDLENLTTNEAASIEDIEAYIRHLRSNEQELHKLVEEYLDLPRREGQSIERDEDRGPPTTHPSAGLSYLRTDAHMYNHPDFGPQENKAPVQGRVIIPQKTGERMNREALIGVAGVVGKDHRKPFFKEEAGVSHYDPDIPGGGKLWTQPKRATIESRGRIDLRLDRANKNAVNIALGVQSEVPPPLPRAAIAGAQDRELPDLTPHQSSKAAPRSNYGLEDMNLNTGSGRATPFFGADDEAPHEALQDLLRGGSMRPRR